jgi:carbon storage regulator CsrA
MLVLSRKRKEKIVLPTLNTAVQVLEIKRGVVRLGIEAPPETPILREELRHQTNKRRTRQTDPKVQNTDEGKQDQFHRRLCEQLKTTSMGLGLLRVQLAAGLLDEANSTLCRIQDDFQLLRYGVEGEMENRSPNPMARARQRKALLVEDDHNQREFLAGFLRQSGLQVDTVGDGCDALHYLRSHAKPDVVLLDMRLPRVDGPTIVREIRSNPAYTGLKIFGVTGYLPEEFGLARGANGIDRWFLKPIDPSALLQELTKELGSSLIGI